MNRLKYVILILILLTLSGCRTLGMSQQNVDGESYVDELYYEYDYDYDDYDDFDRG
ncbi:MAG: hypothetical protein LBQ84_03380 [Flavobacteriaceae bacterium]|jgi:hypothetical protein|nr:hypothetical protein [Flavobacteriaceae bacterium]